MKRLLSALATPLAICLLGCTPKAPAIEVMSGDFDLDPLVGEWRGTYTGTESGRAGSIAFTLRAGETAAFGKVVMIPRAIDSAAAANLTARGSQTIQTGADRQALTIKFVRKQGGKLLGTLDPYMDPDCRCMVNTSFEGSFTDAKTIEGQFSTNSVQPGRQPTGGTWKVTRLRKL